eukprot:6212297-Pleurochrysis_carterae.AAC.2
MWSLAGVAFRARILARQNSSASQQSAEQTTCAGTSAQPPATPAAGLPAMASAAQRFSLSWNPTAASGFTRPSAVPPEPPSSPCIYSDVNDSDESCHDVGTDDESAEGDNAKPDAPAAAKNTTRPGSAYGASMFGSTSRMWDEQESRRVAASTRTKRPTHRDYSARFLTLESVQAAITSRHHCRHKWLDCGELVSCHNALWAR